MNDSFHYRVIKNKEDYYRRLRGEEPPVEQAPAQPPPEVNNETQERPLSPSLPAVNEVPPPPPASPMPAVRQTQPVKPPPPAVPNTTILPRDRSKSLAVVIPAMNEADTIGEVIQQVKRLAPTTILVVVNGSTDATAQIAASQGATVITYSEPLGNDIGRYIGAREVSADIYLFTDGDIRIDASQLLPLVHAVEKGVDLSLNSLEWIMNYPKSDIISAARYFLNYIQGKPELGGENALTIPHAYSAKALQTITKEALSNPLLGNALTIDHGLTVSVDNTFNVLAYNKIRPNHEKKPGEVMSEAYQRMHGDTIETLDYLLKKYGPRLGKGAAKKAGLPQALSKLQWNSSSPVRPYTVVLYVRHYHQQLHSIIEQLLARNIEVIPVMAKGTVQDAPLQIPYIELEPPLDAGVAFSVGSYFAQGDAVLFHDSIQEITIPVIEHYLAETASADVVLNYQSIAYQTLRTTDLVHIGNYLLNVTAGWNELLSSSMLLTPFALSQHGLVRIGHQALNNLAVAHLRASQEELSYKEASYAVAVDGLLQAEREQLLGDLLESFHYWILVHGSRGGFTDGNRQRSLLEAEEPLRKNLANQSLLSIEQALATLYPLESERMVTVN
ncbi:glycosyltransferase [Alkalihalobacillus oceani]|uniref:Glucosyl-3-phosphoglycerate synthase n=1 Tax=Halalkalibacter oceani TaxID=1653776 RepID=A0A9X2DUB0_9BACI|nr:glycosyltransferase [Halalkalibacter oceani]MCM3715558.1 glycosyltransferase [Halalkalibacter oceani]